MKRQLTQQDKENFAYLCGYYSITSYKDLTDWLEVCWYILNKMIGKYESSPVKSVEVIKNFGMVCCNNSPIFSPITYLINLHNEYVEETTQTIEVNSDIPTVKIGNQEWMQEDLKVTHFRNGDIIPLITDGKEWSKMTTAACCYYDNDPKNGMLYNWYAVNDPRVLAPIGFHVASDDEWGTLEKYIYSLKLSTSTAQALASNVGWHTSDDEGAVGNAHTLNNSSGFAALPGGCCGYGNGTFYGAGYYGYWWMASEGSAGYAWCRYLDYYYSHVIRIKYTKSYGFSVRCLRD